MLYRTLAAIALLAPLAPAAAQDPVPPAAVVVAFDSDTIRPLIVEGQANKDTARAVEANDPVRIASISKLIMGLTALRLMDEGKVDLDRDVSEYLGWTLRSPYHPDAPVTLTHLLMHRAGLSDAAGYIIPLGTSLEVKLADPAAWRETGRPGRAGFQYANLGSPLVATALEAASGERYDRLVERLVFAPLGVKACLNWIGCDAAMQARAVTLYRHTGEAARDFPQDLPPNCTIPVAEGEACDIDAYVPGTNASVFSPQGGVRIGMVDLAKIGQALLRMDTRTDFLSRRSQGLWFQAMIAAANHYPPDEATRDFCGYGLASYGLVEAEPCRDDLFMDGSERIGHGGEAYGLRSGLWLDMGRGSGLAYFTTAVPPPPGGEDTGGSDPREVELMQRALALSADRGD
ncbi:beta-lactamase family protein [Erythrobacter sp. NFXS35]|uniref:serine hydrolase domain-containing protein n=1 Tax=Erythrobacter sp. NFXS35 TaxID=2818436 RepID=UPI0032DEBF9F